MDEKDLLKLAIIAALEAGDEIRSIYDTDFSVEQKEDQSPLTLADQSAHDIISNLLTDTNIPILSEEGKHLGFQERSNWERLWIVDPLDGTKEFVKKNGEFTVNIALVENGQPILGVVYVPVSGDLYYSSEQIGAFKASGVFEYDESVFNLGAKMPLSVYEERDIYVAVGSRSHLSDETQKYFDSLSDEHGRIQIMSKGSSLKLCMVAEGAADVYPRFAPTMEWDTAAGHAVCKHAGCEVMQYEKDEPLVYNKENLLNPWFLVSRERKEYI